MATRLEMLLGEVLEALDTASVKNIKKTRILLALDRAQQEVCQKGMALEGDDEIVLGKGQKVYSLDINLWKIRSIKEPGTWTKPLEIIEDANRWKELVRDQSITTRQPLYCMVWAKMFRCTPAPVVSGEKLELMGYRFPDEPLTATTEEPEVGVEWDDAMIANAIGRLLKEPPNGPHMVEFEQELEKVKASNVAHTAAGGLKRQHWSDRIGF